MQTEKDPQKCGLFSITRNIFVAPALAITTFTNQGKRHDKAESEIISPCVSFLLQESQAASAQTVQVSSTWFQLILASIERPKQELSQLKVAVRSLESAINRAATKKNIV